MAVNYKFLDSFHLKLIAIITMLIDHIGAVLFPQIIVLRYIGRISFPIFCFLLVEGFTHTKSVKKYLIRMGLFAIISEIPYDLAFKEKILEFKHQNVFFTLFLGLLLLFLVSKTSNIVEKITVFILILWVSEFIASDYGARGIILILGIYLFRETTMIAYTSIALWSILWLNVIKIQIYGSFAVLPISLYNGKQGRQCKYIFYIFYPLHLLILYSLRKYS